MMLKNLKFLPNRQINKAPNINKSGSILIFEILIIFIFSMVMLGLLSYATAAIRITRSTIYREQAFQIAEAGANYYQWHLAYFPNDFWDGNSSSTPGPYIHNYTDVATGKIIGQYSLKITPPPVGSTVVTIQSTGYTLAAPQTDRIVTVRYGVPSLAQYAFLTNSVAWIGASENISGQFFSNNGIRFDGTGNAPIMSAKSTYTCPYESGCGTFGMTKPGIWGSAPQTTKNYWQFPLANVDFSAITANFATLKSSAQSGGIFLSSSNKSGYSLIFNANGTMNIYLVTSLTKYEPTGYDVNGKDHSESTDYNNRTLLYANKAIPSNGIIYIEDNTWVEGTVKGRAMVVVGKLPYNSDSAPELYISDNLVYAAKDGSNSLGLIGQKDILISYGAPDVLEIDGALIAQYGSAQCYNWPNLLKTSLTIYGALASYGIWTWSWVDTDKNVVSGYKNTYTFYDGNLLYSPPPSFPLSSAGYQQIYWNAN